MKVIRVKSLAYVQLVRPAAPGVSHYRCVVHLLKPVVTRSLAVSCLVGSDGDAHMYLQASAG